MERDEGYNIGSFYGKRGNIRPHLALLSKIIDIGQKALLLGLLEAPSSNKDNSTAVKATAAAAATTAALDLKFCVYPKIFVQYVPFDLNIIKL